jgi:hypothetical protein
VERDQLKDKWDYLLVIQQSLIIYICYIALNDRMFMNSDLRMMWSGTLMACSKVVSQHLSGRMKEKYRKPQNSETRMYKIQISVIHTSALYDDT